METCFPKNFVTLVSLLNDQSTFLPLGPTRKFLPSLPFVPALGNENCAGLNHSFGDPIISALALKFDALFGTSVSPEEASCRAWPARLGVNPKPLRNATIGAVHQPCKA